MSTTGFQPNDPSFGTKAIHDGQDPEKWTSNCMIPPIIMSTTFKQIEPAVHKGYVYGRSGNPTREVLETCLASLDNAKYGLVYGSGLGATTTVIHLLNAGEHFVAMDDLYGGTLRYFSQVAQRMNINVTYIDGCDLKKMEDAIRDNTKLIWIETPTNPLLKVANIRKICDMAHKKNILVAVDNTFLTPYFQKPLNLGADIAVYSLTKYMNGHTDVVMGAVTTNNDVVYEKLRFLQKAMGIVPSPFDCYLVNRSLKTLHVRMREHMANGLAVGKFLEGHPVVEKLIHPGLPSHPQHELLLQQCHGYSGMISFYIKGGLKEATRFLSSLKVLTLAESLGGYESLAQLPYLMSHASIPAEQREKLGITDNLIRLSIGLESSDDIIKDLDQALHASVK